ncbi:MAG TPA: hypothetical protein VKT80_11000, partial [Chloroflexota bacterium]|nr:hypothetical protein [Chloroflexota bacterium]
ETYTLKNNNPTGGDNLNFHITSPAFDSRAKVNWRDPTAGLYPDITFNTLVWGTNSDSFSASTSPTTRTAPSGFFTAPTGLAPGSTFGLTLRYQYSKNDNGKTSLTTSPTQKLCISYQIPSEPGVTKFCNIVGQAATTNNPTSCD